MLDPTSTAGQAQAADPAPAHPEPCDFGEHACQPVGRVCVGWKAAEQWPRSAGQCLQANVSYVPSYSTDFRSVHDLTEHNNTCSDDSNHICQHMMAYH